MISKVLWFHSPKKPQPSLQADRVGVSEWPSHEVSNDSWFASTLVSSPRNVGLFTPREPETPRSFVRVVNGCSNINVSEPTHVTSPRLMSHSSAVSSDNVLYRIMDEYSQKISDLASLTADLPRRLHSLEAIHPTTRLEIDESAPHHSPEENDRAGVLQRSKTQIFILQEGWQIDQCGDRPDHLATAQRGANLVKKLASLASLDSDACPQFSSASESSTNLIGSASPWFISPPTKPRRMAWEFFGLLLVLYDMIVVPLSLTFKPSGVSVIDVMDWIGLVYWTLNIPVALTTGFFSDGVVIMELSRICCQYLKTWFIVDLLTVVPDWISTISDLVIGESNDDGSSTMKVLRALRFLRLTRLLRMVRLGNAWNALYDRIYSEKIGIVAEVARLILLLMLVNHFNACLWFAIGNSADSKSWVKHYRYTLQYVDWPYQYMVAYHWSITLFTPASMSLQPQSFKERVFAIVVVILGLVGFCSIIGRITASMNQLMALREVKHKSFSLLRKYLKARHVDQELSIRIRTYLDYRWEQQHAIALESKVEILGLLSESLRAELASAVHAPTLAIHPLFLQVQCESSMTMGRLMLKGVSLTSLAPHDWMFHAGEEATCMSMVIGGSLEYFRLLANAQLPPIVIQAKQDWIAEQVLWVQQWHHLGDLRSLSSTDLLRIAADKLLEIVSLNPVAFQIVSSYARNYVSWLNEKTESDLSDVSLGAQAIDELRGLLEVSTFAHTASMPRHSVWSRLPKLSWSQMA